MANADLRVTCRWVLVSVPWIDGWVFVTTPFCSAGKGRYIYIEVSLRLLILWHTSKSRFWRRVAVGSKVLGTRFGAALFVLLY